MKGMQNALREEFYVGGFWYLWGLFLLLCGIFAGGFTAARTGAALQYGGGVSLVDMLLCALGPCCLLLLGALLGLPGVPVEAAVMIFWGFWMSCGPCLPWAGAGWALQVPALLVLFKKCFVTSIKWCKIRKRRPDRMYELLAVFRVCLWCAPISLAALLLGWLAGGR